LTIEHFPLYRFLIPYQIAGVGAIFNRWSGLAFWPAIRDGFRPRCEAWRTKARTTVTLLRPSTWMGRWREQENHPHTVQIP
jgi:hypothetical protein